MYGCNKLYCEQLGRYYARHYKQLAAEPRERARRFPRGPLPGPDLGGDGAVRRHLRLRARDDSRRGAGASRTRASCGRTRAFRSWRCPTASTRCCARRGAARGADADRLQRRRVHPDGRRDPRRWSLRAFPDAEITSTSTRSARASSTPGRPTSTTAPRGATGASPPRYDFDRAFADYLIPTIRERYSRG